MPYCPEENSINQYPPPPRPPKTSLNGQAVGCGGQCCARHNAECESSPREKYDDLPDTLDPRAHRSTTENLQMPTDVAQQRSA